MATVRHVTNLALRKLGVLGGGRDARPTDAADALAGLQGLYQSWIASGAFGRLYDRVPQGTQYVARGNERIMRRAGDDIEIILPEFVSDGIVPDYGRELRSGYYGTIISITAQGNDTVVDIRPSQPIGCVQSPRDGSVVIITDEATGNVLTSIYDGTLKKWEQIESLQQDDEAPRSTADASGLASCLAVEIADQFGAELSEVTVSQAARFRMQMTHRYGMRRESVMGVYI